MNLKNKRVLITGSSSGIGQATAIEFAKKGAIVFINYKENEKGAMETLNEVKKYSDGKIFKADLTNISEIKKMVIDIVKEYKNIDVLVNNASDYVYGDIDNIKTWNYNYEGVLMTVVNMTMEFLKQTSGKRKILNTTSVYGNLQTSSTGNFQYSAMKAALSNFTVNLAKKYSGKEVNVNAIAPGWTQTPSWDGVSKERIKKIEKRLSIGRMIKMSEIAHTFIYLAENDAVNGQIITVDGGLFMELS